MEKALGMSPNDVDRVTIVLHDVEREQAWIVVSCSKPLDRNKLLERTGAKTTEVQHRGKTYFPSGGHGKPAVHFVTDRLLFWPRRRQSSRTSIKRRGRAIRAK